MGQARPAFAADCAKQGSVMSASISRIRIFAADDDPIAVNGSLVWLRFQTWY